LNYEAIRQVATRVQVSVTNVLVGEANIHEGHMESDPHNLKIHGRSRGRIKSLCEH